ncbi:DUF805 domain-containing protein [Fructobacillus papyrifericola]|uniref:DUF805 domain-containing protein n=1 Tax=Fructobacillus papyrifericola TaxID=2713172 RepID=A0ABS5QTE0_9LACO|nr:DUF805 domain-containing protein [Fructobacillus papyrifericola]MBS9336468.1 DUF805 domain-containing protein [Fructobacillus papyrifericola]
MKAYQDFLEHYFNLSERTNRSTYWAVAVINLLFLVGFALVFKLLFTLLTMVEWFFILDILVAFITITWLVLTTFFLLAIFIPSITISVRRYRDTGLSLSFFVIEPAVFLAICWCVSEYVVDGYASIWAVVITGLLLLADVLIKLLPSAD